jgi:outer membrane protein OmpA-like peptidoglycan-associated protein
MRKLASGLAALLFTILWFTPAQAIDSTPASLPFYPTSVSGVLTNPSDSSTTRITVSWSGHSANGSPITSIEASAYSGASWATRASVSCSAPETGTSCIITGLAFATAYKFKVTVTNAIGSATSNLSTDSVTTPSQPQTVTITPASIPSSFVYGNADFQLSASATSGLAIAWSVPSTTSICSVDLSGSVHFLSVGTCVVRATQDGGGSSYSSAFDEATITASATLSATIADATSIQSVQATLNGIVPFPGAITTPTFCISRTNNVTSGCSLPSGVTIAGYSPSSITSTSGSAVSATVSGLNQSTTYYYWLTVTASGATPYSTGTATFTTTTGPSIAFSGTRAGVVGTSMTGTLTASSGTGVYSSWSASTYPTGLTFEPGVTASTSLISGVPTVAGTYTALFTVTDTSGIDSSVTVSYTISEAPTTPTPTTTPGDSGSSGAVVNIPAAEPEAESVPTKASNSPDSKFVTDNLNETELRVGGTKQEISISANTSGNGLVVSSGPGGFTIEVESDSSLYSSQSTGNTKLAVKSGSDARLSGEIFAPTSQIDFYIYSKATWVGGAFADQSGRFSGKASAFKSLPLGFHTLQLVGRSPEGAQIVVNMPIVILPPDGKVDSISDAMVTKTIVKPVPTAFYLRDIPKSASLGWPKNIAPVIKGITSIKLGKKLIQVNPQSGFSGIALFTIVVKTKNIAVERMVSLTVLPPAVVTGSYAPTGPAQTKISWRKVSGVSSYRVNRNGSTICVAKTNSCSVKAMFGPASAITVSSIGNDGTESKPLKIRYINAKYVLAALVNFDDNSSNLSQQAVEKLGQFMNLVREEGFQTVQVYGYSDSTGSSDANQVLSAARAKSVTSFITGQVAGFVESIGKGMSKPVKTNATKEGRAANRRVEIYVS